MYAGNMLQRSPKLSRSLDMETLGHGSSSSKFYTSSISQPPSVRSSPIPSRIISSPSQTYRSRHLRISRSSNNSPLNLPEGPHFPHSISSRAFNTGGVYYGDEFNRPIMDIRASASEHRSRSVNRPMRGYQSLERVPDREYISIREPRQRSLGGVEIDSRHSRGRDHSMEEAMFMERDQSDMYYTERESVIDSVPYAENGPYDTRPTHTFSVNNLDKHNEYSRDNFIMELQSRLNELQNQYGTMKRELDVTTQKLGSSMHSIKTYWSPELKKERALRKEEAAKYALMNEQMKMFRSENQ
ncbi:uncharacterized protein LOC111087938, partial [Limulus polyphemus]|uniref:Uncharacterized protein LOC111087938 n=1 Tax=Limulus polyphemus TaxID=6850 RepID=A0ABM1T8B4_LIMPO